jgi:hypothetical protein
VKKTVIVVGVLLLFIICWASLTGKESHITKPGALYLAELLQKHDRIIDTNAIFLPGTRCKGCHGRDPQGIANVTLAGIDINLFDDWETSMMGLAGVDPFWKAKVRQEVMMNPNHANELQLLCTSCHAPTGHYNAFYRGQSHYTLEDLNTDSLGLSGVSCLGCHAIGAEGIGSTFTGNIPYDTTRKAYGPFVNPMTGPMQLYVNFTPKYSAHVSQGSFCSPCHTLISNTVDLEGNEIGNTFVEQATYHEWLNSIYPNQERPCQNCHMPQIEDPVKIAVGYTALPGRSPYNLHTFAGANTFMIQLMKNNKGELGINANDANFDSTLAATTRQLRRNTLKAEIAPPVFFDDSVSFDVTLTNKAGHKFPSGYPARKAFVQFILTSDAGDTLFASGLFDQLGHILNYSGVTEGHHNIINSEEQVQVYEMMMADVNGNLTTILERADEYIIDNRLPPAGFTTSHSTYDTVRIVGAALTDPDFNKNGIVEGTGKDILHFHFPYSSLTQHVNASVKVYYQAVPPTWLGEMRSLSAPEIQTFLSMYDNADHTPFLVADDTLQSVFIPLGERSGFAANKLSIFPNPANSLEPVLITGAEKIMSIEVFQADGKKLKSTFVKKSNNTWELYIQQYQGIVFVSISTNKTKEIRKLILK